MIKKILFIVAHPYLKRSVANKYIAEHLKNVPNITIHDLYEEYPYFNIDIKREQQLLTEHDMIVFQHPFFWYNMPPLLKLWEDEVLETGFAYGTGGSALRGKEFLLSITTGGSSEAYSPSGSHRHLVHNFLLGYEQICQLCGLRWNSPYILHSSRNSSDSDIFKHANNLKNQLIKYIEEGHI